VRSALFRDKLSNCADNALKLSSIWRVKLEASLVGSTAVASATRPNLTRSSSVLHCGLVNDRKTEFFPDLNKQVQVIICPRDRTLLEYKLTLVCTRSFDETQCKLQIQLNGVLIGTVEIYFLLANNIIPTPNSWALTPIHHLCS
jgi:hypothetical protein